MKVVFLISVIVNLSYIILIIYYLIGWKKTKIFVNSGSAPANLRVSVVIPFRNDSKNLEKLLADLANQDFPAECFEIIAINDHSDDINERKLAGLSQCIHNGNILELPTELNGKKMALDYGIRQAKGELILQTDADCRVTERWISTFTRFYARNNSPELIMGPVDYITESNLASGSRLLNFLV